MRSLVAVGVLAVAGTAGCLNLIFPFAPDQIAETQLRASCGFFFRCCLAVERSAAGGSSAPDEATCIEEGLEEGGGNTLLGQRAKAAIDAGNAEYDAGLADECMKKFVDAANACDAEAFLRPAPDPECAAGFARMFTKGKVDDGDDCVDDLECADEGACIREEEDEGVTVEGKCRAAAGEGDDCSERNCQTGLQCGFDAESGELRCEELELLDDGEECFGDDSCKSGSCVEVESGECSDSGDACDNDSDCDEENFEFCDVDFRDECAPAGGVEICDGK